MEYNSDTVMFDQIDNLISTLTVDQLYLFENELYLYAQGFNIIYENHLLTIWQAFYLCYILKSAFMIIRRRQKIVDSSNNKELVKEVWDFYKSKYYEVTQKNLLNSYNIYLAVIQNQQFQPYLSAYHPLFMCDGINPYQQCPGSEIAQFYYKQMQHGISIDIIYTEPMDVDFECKNALLITRSMLAQYKVFKYQEQIQFLSILTQRQLQEFIYFFTVQLNNELKYFQYVQQNCKDDDLDFQVALINLSGATHFSLLLLNLAYNQSQNSISNVFRDNLISAVQQELAVAYPYIDQYVEIENQMKILSKLPLEFLHRLNIEIYQISDSDSNSLSTKRQINHFTDEQKIFIVQLKQNNEQIKYSVIAQLVNERYNTSYNSKQIQQCWTRVLRPGVKKGPWSRQEDGRLIDLFTRYHGDLQQVSSAFQQRDCVQIKRRAAVLRLI